MSKSNDDINDRRDGRYVPGTVYYCDFNPTLDRYAKNPQGFFRRETDCRNTAIYACGKVHLCYSCAEHPRFSKRKKRKLCRPDKPVPVVGDVVTSRFDDLIDAIVIGEPEYSIADGQRVIATPQASGAPYSTDWLALTGERRLKLALYLRSNYLRAFPGSLKPLN